MLDLDRRDVGCAALMVRVVRYVYIRGVIVVGVVSCGYATYAVDGGNLFGR